MLEARADAFIAPKPVDDRRPQSAFRWVAFGLIAILILAAAAGHRFADLGSKPMHHDEAEQGMFFVRLLEEGHYRYNPKHFHGPTLYYFTLVSATLRGESNAAEISEITLRLVTATGGFLLVLAPLFLRSLLGHVGALTMAGLMALSPLLVYYSRYYVQEIWLATFAMWLLVALWHYARRPGWGWALFAGLIAGLAHATKETFALFVAGAIVCFLVARFVTRKSPESTPSAGNRASWVHLLLFFGVAATVSVTFFTSFFTNPGGPMDSLRALYLYETNPGHNKPWDYYLSILTGAVVRRSFLSLDSLIFVLAVVGLVVAWFGRTRTEGVTLLRRVVTLHGFLLLIVYSCFTYNAPWLLVAVLPQMAFAAGITVQTFWRIPFNGFIRIPMVVLLFWGAWHLHKQTLWANEIYPADDRNPYAYVHTSTDLLNLVERVQKTHTASGNPGTFSVFIFGPEHGPLAWYLRTVPRIGFWTGMEEAPGSIEADVVICDPELLDAIEPRLSGSYEFTYRGMRPGYILTAFFKE